ncbi:gliding motility-associated ABC transporter ATP-binding subunit GldA [Polaribacter sp. MED152]|uniref:gliding motility-associated ABC transporter ATP-binding subunit GldA n=1 Tax=Polaribacter sp. MED152 TaxID=313598 RepID=UPI0000689B46|nr:gliding motility-associated ABC transporter ATP-binding subunit GldA [Polaribacter sp. MED152]EAQ40718.1 gliding motility protein GldA [Polaribacter sp. MED152]
MSIQITSVSKLYKDQKALNDISFSAKKGEIIGFLGPNGAGKSTMMKILTGFIKPNSGTVLVDEIDVLEKPIESQKNIGYLPEHNPLYAEMYVREYLQFRAQIYKVDKSQVEICIEKVGLTAEAHKKINQLSKGYQQRVGIAAAILHNPSVLILDEPTTGLDPNQLVEIRALIKELGKEKTVLLSTHIMQEVEAVCDKVVIIKKGEILLEEDLKNLNQKKQQIIEVTFSAKLDEQLFSQLTHLNSTKKVNDTTWQLSFSSEEDMRPKVFDFAKQHDLQILELSSKNKNLETLFREVTA